MLAASCKVIGESAAGDFSRLCKVTEQVLGSVLVCNKEWKGGGSFSAIIIFITRFSCQEARCVLQTSCMLRLPQVQSLDGLARSN